MEYVHYTLLNRSDNFSDITPKTWFEQWEIYRRINGIGTEEKEEQEMYIDDVL